MQAVYVPAPLDADELRLSMTALPDLRERMPLTLAVAPANVYGRCIAMACRDAVVRPYQFDPESDPGGEAPEEAQTLRLQQDVSEWLVCLNNVSLFYVFL